MDNNQEQVSTTTVTTTTTNETGAIQLTGHLYKRSSTVFMVWKKRFFVLQDSPIPIDKLKLIYMRRYILTDAANPKNHESGEMVVHSPATKQLFERMALATVTGRGLLFYYEDDNSHATLQQPLDIIDLSQITKCSIAHFSGRLHTIQLRLGTCDQQQTIYLSASSKSQMEQWKAAIQEASLGSAAYHDTLKSTNIQYLEAYEAISSGRAFKFETLGSHDTEDERSTTEIAIVDASPHAFSTADGENNAANVAFVESAGIEDSDGDTSIDSLSTTILQQSSSGNAGKSGIFSYLFPCASTQAVSAVDHHYDNGESAPYSTMPTDLDIYQCPTDFIVKGWLLKQSDYLKMWNRRYVVLYHDYLAYFRPSSKPKYDFDVKIEFDAAQLRIEPYETKESPYSFQIFFDDSKYSLKLAAESESDLEAWMSAFGYAAPSGHH